MDVILYSMLSGAFVILVAALTTVAILAFVTGMSKHPKFTIIITLLITWLVLTVLFYLSTISGSNIG